MPRWIEREQTPCMHRFSGMGADTGVAAASCGRSVGRACQLLLWRPHVQVTDQPTQAKRELVPSCHFPQRRTAAFGRIKIDALTEEELIGQRSLSLELVRGSVLQHTSRQPGKLPSFLGRTTHHGSMDVSCLSTLCTWCQAVVVACWS